MIGLRRAKLRCELTQKAASRQTLRLINSLSGAGQYAWRSLVGIISVFANVHPPHIQQTTQLTSRIIRRRR